MNNEFKNVREFRQYRLDISKKFLWYRNKPVSLPLKAVELLCLLVESRGEVVTKAEIWGAVWKDSFVEETNLTHTIYLLRKTFKRLGDDNFIETVPRRGYRFVADVCSRSNEVKSNRLLKSEEFNSVKKQFAKQMTVSTSESEARVSVLSETLEPNPSRPIRSIAVLPFKNECSHLDLDYLSDGITENLIDNLSLLPGLRVIARSTVFRYTFSVDEDIDSVKIGNELDVEAIITGKILLFKGNLTVKVEIVTTSNGAQVWGDQYCRKLDDVLEIQNELANEISANLQPVFDKGKNILFPRGQTLNPEAYKSYLKGRYFWNKRTAEWMKKGIECFQQALDQDPFYDLPYTGLADSYISLATIGALSPHTAIPKAKAAALMALEINEGSAPAHAALGFITNSYDWDWGKSDWHFQRAAEINANYSLSFHWHGFCLIARKRFSTSIELMKQARRLDPLSPIINIACGLPFYFMRNYRRAIKIYKEVLETETSFFPGYAYLGMALEQNDQFEEALSVTEKALLLAPGNTFATTSLAHIYAVCGKEDKALQIIDQLNSESKAKYVSSYGMAEIYAGLNLKKEALKYLAKAARERSWWLVFMNVNPRFDCLRTEPEFYDILGKMNLS